MGLLGYYCFLRAIPKPIRDSSLQAPVGVAEGSCVGGTDGLGSWRPVGSVLRGSQKHILQPTAMSSGQSYYCVFGIVGLHALSTLETVCTFGCELLGRSQGHGYLRKTEVGPTIGALSILNLALPC